MKPSLFIAFLSLCSLFSLFALVASAQESAAPANSPEPSAIQLPAQVAPAPAGSAPTHIASAVGGLSRSTVLVTSLTVFALAVFVGFEVIAKVPPTLHTPLMSGSNAISGITVVGSIIAAGNSSGGIACFFAMIAIALATVNVVGGFVVTYRMLLMFKKR